VSIVSCARPISIMETSNPGQARSLSSWSARRVILACTLWLLGAPVLAAIGLILGGLVLGLLSGTRKISLTAHLTGWATGTWLFVPPIALVAAWLWNRRSANDMRTAGYVISEELSKPQLNSGSTELAPDKVQPRSHPDRESAR
jgi:hypothetical protein